ncbi:hypothetical protein JCM11641_005402 [Rhodosporidiobolus odoratus]
MAKRKNAAQLSASSTTSMGSPSKPASTSPASPLPYAHYLPRLPLQLVAVLFSVFAASSTVIKDDSLIGFSRVVAALTRDPLAVLPIACGLVAVVQTWFGYWAMTCRRDAKKLAEAATKGEVEAPKQPVREKKRLGFKGSFGALWDRALKGETPHKTVWKTAQRKKPGDVLGGLDTRFVPQAVGMTLGGTAVFHVCAVLLGAPLFSNFTETFLLSFLVSILSVLPLAIAVPPLNSTNERYVWLRLFSALSPEDDLEFALLAPALGAIIGCWSGAIPIPLDWDRPWQKWPTTCVLGALFGHAAGSVLSLFVTGYRGALRTAADVVREAGEQEQQAVLPFCSPEHQKLIWKTHKKVCGPKGNPFQAPPLDAEETERAKRTCQRKSMTYANGKKQSLSSLTGPSTPTVPRYRAKINRDGVLQQIQVFNSMNLNRAGGERDGPSPSSPVLN